MVHRPAGFWIRFGAILLDTIILGITSFFIASIIGLTDKQSDTFHGFIEFFYSLLLPVFWYGYTIGKRICGVRICKVSGENVTIGTMLMRNLVAGLVYVITLGIGVIVSLFMVIFREDKRSLHDLIAGTYVTYDKPDENPFERDDDSY
ncbi:RDD family protein [Anaerobacillus sp. MEB173]|uniref:RDD family protein n=1 Tax=Anaerobacillus sp. MEB173 TaxID=3383345 RepID=UPI003F8DFF42